MINFKYIKTMFLVLFTALILTGSNFYTDKVIAEPVAEKTVTTQEVNEQFISPHLIVNSPKSYLNQTVNIKAKFDKFSTLGLDYKSAFKSSEEYISSFVFNSMCFSASALFKNNFSSERGISCVVSSLFTKKEIYSSEDLNADL